MFLIILMHLQWFVLNVDLQFVDFPNVRLMVQLLGTFHVQEIQIYAKMLQMMINIDYLRNYLFRQRQFDHYVEIL